MNSRYKDSIGMYILAEDGKTPVQTEDSIRWDQFLKSADRAVRKTDVNGVMVSTVFLGLDHNFYLHGSPILWETVVFGGPLDQAQERYSSYEDAVEGHEIMVTLVRAALDAQPTPS